MFHEWISRVVRAFRRVRHAGMEQRTVLAVTRNERYMTDMRILAIQQSWSVRFATTLGQALEIRPRSGVCVVIYDRDVSRGDCAAAIRLLTHSENPVFCILLGDGLRDMVVGCGGYDVASKPVDHEKLIGLINGALALAAEIDACQAAMAID